LFFDFLFLKLQFMQIKIKYNSEILIVITVVRFSFSYSADIFEPFLLHGITLENQILWHFFTFHAEPHHVIARTPLYFDYSCEFIAQLVVQQIESNGV